MKNYRAQGVHQCVLGYCGGGKVYTAEEWLPLFGHVKDGKIDGTMFTAATLMPSPVHVYYSNDLNNRVGFDNWVQHVLTNAANINEAVGKVKAALGLTDYTVKLFPAVFDPSSDFGNAKNHFADWGELNGITMDSRLREHCKMMMQYLVDAYLREFAKAAFEHVELVGFYMFDEGLNLNKMDWYREVTELFHQNGMLAVVAPYFKSNGYDVAKSVGIDLVAMQSNYFPEGRLAELNNGTIDRIDLNLSRITEIGIGITVEMSDAQEVCVTAYKTTIKKCIEYGFTDQFHLHYHNGALLGCIASEDEYIHSAYDDLYAYIHGKQDPDKLWIKQPKPQRTIDRQIFKGVLTKPLTASDWLPMVGYIKDGAVADTMFSMTTIEPPLEAVQRGEYRTKAQWDAWVDTTFAALDALEQAAEKTAQALQKEKCPVGVLFSLFNTRDGAWGELDGETMNTADLEHRRRMVIYLIKRYRDTLAARGYRHIGFNGFYWTEPLIRKEEIDWYVRVADHIQFCFADLSRRRTYAVLPRRFRRGDDAAGGEYRAAVA